MTDTCVICRDRPAINPDPATGYLLLCSSTLCLDAAHALQGGEHA